MIKEDHLAPADLQIAGSHALYDHGAACHWDGFQFQAFRLEKSFFHGHEHGSIVDNFHIARLPLRLSPAQSPRKGQAGNADGQSSDKITPRNSHVASSYW